MDDSQTDLQLERPDQDADGPATRVSAWLVSVILHAAVLAILAGVIWFSQPERREPAVRTVHIEHESPKPPVTTETEDPVVPTVEIMVEPTDMETVITITDPLDTTESTTQDEIVTEDARGRDDALAAMEMGSEGLNAAIGAFGGASGMHGTPGGGGDGIRRLRNKYGQHAKPALDRIERALRWLARHQSPDGAWSSANYWQNCDREVKCEPGRAVTGGDEAMTGYAVLSFLGAGHDHKTPNRWLRQVRGGLEWLLARQQESGLIGTRNYEHAVATMALAEAYAMTADPLLREPAQRAINALVARQARDGDGYGLAWDYTAPQPNRNDSSVSGWAVMALKSGAVGGLNIGDGLTGAKRWLERAWQSANPNHASIDAYGSSVFPYTWNAETGAVSKDHLSFVGALCAVFLGHGEGDPMLGSMLNDMQQRWLTTNKWQTNSYCLYYASMAAFQGGGQHWTAWRDAYLPHLFATQVIDDGTCADGSWPWTGETFHGGDTSRVLIHCYKLLSLEVALRAVDPKAVRMR